MLYNKYIMDTNELNAALKKYWEENIIPNLSEPFEGQQQLNKSTGEVEVYHNGDWCTK
jgi:hypothetical protein